MLQPPFDAVTVDPIHLVPRLVTAESGIAAGPAWLRLVLAAPRAAWRRRARLIFWMQAPAALTLPILSGLDHSLWTLAPGRVLFWTSLGIIAALGAQGDERSESPSLATV
jgi:hypothetical protein